MKIVCSIDDNTRGDPELESLTEQNILNAMKPTEGAELEVRE